MCKKETAVFSVKRLPVHRASLLPVIVVVMIVARLTAADEINSTTSTLSIVQSGSSNTTTTSSSSSSTTTTTTTASTLPSAAPSDDAQQPINPVTTGEQPQPSSSSVPSSPSTQSHQLVAATYATTTSALPAGDVISSNDDTEDLTGSGFKAEPTGDAVIETGRPPDEQSRPATGTQEQLDQGTTQGDSSVSETSSKSDSSMPETSSGGDSSVLEASLGEDTSVPEASLGGDASVPEASLETYSSVSEASLTGKEDGGTTISTILASVLRGVDPEGSVSPEMTRTPETSTVEQSILGLSRKWDYESPATESYPTASLAISFSTARETSTLAHGDGKPHVMYKMPMEETSSESQELTSTSSATTTSEIRQPETSSRPAGDDLVAFDDVNKLLADDDVMTMLPITTGLICAVLTGLSFVTIVFFIYMIRCIRYRRRKDYKPLISSDFEFYN